MCGEPIGIDYGWKFHKQSKLEWIATHSCANSDDGANSCPERFAANAIDAAPKQLVTWTFITDQKKGEQKTLGLLTRARARTHACEFEFVLWKIKNICNHIVSTDDCSGHHIAQYFIRFTFQMFVRNVDKIPNAFDDFNKWKSINKRGIRGVCTEPSWNLKYYGGKHFHFRQYNVSVALFEF